MRRNFDLTGQRFDRLVVIEKGKERQDRYSTWKCKCDCGGEIIVNTKRLKRGTITNCGCEPKNLNLRGSKPADLAGKRYGRLTVISRAENNINGRTRWLCICDCGNECIVNTHELNSGKTKSCGCFRKETSRKRTADITGQKFGRLTTLYPIDKRDSKGSVYWHCKCECGNEVDITHDGLVYGSYRSCGCYKKEINASIHESLTFIENTCVEILRNRKSRRDNTSGFRGVYAMENGKWRATIGLQGKVYNIGRFATFEEAVEARLEVEKILHDDFVKVYDRWNEIAKENEEWGERNPFFFRVIKEGNTFKTITPFSGDNSIIKYI